MENLVVAWKELLEVGNRFAKSLQKPASGSRVHRGN